MKGIALIAAGALISAAIVVHGERNRIEVSPYQKITSGDYRCTVDYSAGQSIVMEMITSVTPDDIVIERRDLETTIPSVVLIPRREVTLVSCLEEEHRQAMVEAIAELRRREGLPEGAVDIARFAPDAEEQEGLRRLVVEMERRMAERRVSAGTMR